MRTRNRVRSGTIWLGALALPLLILALVVGGSRGSRVALAQDEATPAADAGRPAHIHTGTCNDTEEESLGDVVQALTNATAPTGTGGGQEDAASPVETSVTIVPLALDALLAEDHVINVHLSVDEITTYIACGEIGGTIADADTSLTIGLREQDGSGFVGVAYLAPGADGISTLVSLFVAEGLAGDGVGGAADEGAAEETPAPDEAAADATPES